MLDTAFSITKNTERSGGFCLHEKCWHEYLQTETVRGCLQEHQRALVARLEALDAVLATSEPERAERLLLDSADMQIDEVTLKPIITRDRFETIMRESWKQRD